MRIIFAGTPEFAAAHLDCLIKYMSATEDSTVVETEEARKEHEHKLVAVYTQPDRKAGRGKKLLPSPVKTLALENNIPVYQPLSFKNTEDLEHLKALEADLMIVAAYGMLLPKTVLDLPRYGCINIHASLLPRWRGAAPIERSIIAGDDETGITIMQMAEGLDTGDMLLKDSCPISSNETGDSLREKLITLGRPLLISALQGIVAQSLTPEIQNDDLSCYAQKLKKQEGEIDWSAPASLIARKIRAFTSAMPSFTLLENERIRINSATALAVDDGIDTETISPLSRAATGQIVKITDSCLWVSCGSEDSTAASEKTLLSISQVQLPGKRAMSIKDILNGRPDLFQVQQRFHSTQRTD